MPIGVAIETSGKIGSVAIVDDGRDVAAGYFVRGLHHADEPVPMLDLLSRNGGWGPKDIKHIYVSAGPGSFTGLRIGITVAKTMALVGGAKIVAVPTARVLAENAPADAKHLIIVLDAKRDQIFTARFERDAHGWLEREPAHLDSLTAMLARSPRPVFLLGEGIPYHEKFVPKDDPGVIVTPADRWLARAEAVAKIGMTMAERGEFSDPFTLIPTYVRRPEAEEKREAMGL
jgi:tRNA threonylcarbamoyladenosine biosynthesis protein TsaB